MKLKKQLTINLANNLAVLSLVGLVASSAPASSQAIMEMGNVYAMPKPMGAVNSAQGAINNLYGSVGIPTGGNSAAGVRGAAGDNPKLAAVYVKQANDCYKLAQEKEKAGKLAEAQTLYLRSALCREAIWGFKDPAVWTIYGIVGKLAKKQKKYADMEAAYKKQLQYGIKHYGVGSFELVPVLETLAEALSDEKKYSDAVSYRKQVYELKKRKFGESDPLTINALCDLAAAHLSANDIAQAKTAVAIGLKVREKAQEPKAPQFERLAKLEADVAAKDKSSQPASSEEENNQEVSASTEEAAGNAAASAGGQDSKKSGESVADKSGK
ncbi:MAG TPA: tetratricopeptide repeat protein [Candidatus Obscuribacterales bacterium]